MPSKALPMRTRCPLCGHGDGLDLYHDNTSGGQWHHCRACGSAGDMIELACRVWDVGPVAAVHKLAADHGIRVPEALLAPTAIEDYVREYPEQRRRMTRLWAAARASYPANRCDDVQRVRKRHMLTLDVAPARWRAGPGHLVGAAGRREVELAYYPSLYAHGINSAQGTGSGRQVFKGRGWGDVLACAFHDLPDRIRAFAFVGRQGRMPVDEVFKAVVSRGKGRRGEAGLAGTASVSLAGDPIDVIAVDDWMLALRVQMRTFRSSLRPLALVAWRDDGTYRTRHAWNMLTGKRVTFWAPGGLDHRVLMQAVECGDGRISTAGPERLNDRRAVGHYLRLHPGTDFRRVVLANAMPWPVALRRFGAADEEGGRMLELVARLEAAGADVSYIFRQAGAAKCHDRIIRHISAVPAVRSVSVDACTIVEQNDAWYVEIARGRSEICNATLRMTHAVKDRASGQVFYRGEIRYKGTSVPFIERVEVVQHTPTEFMTAKLAEAGLGVLSHAHRFAKNLHQIAVQFFEPEFVTDDLYKWVERMRAGQT